LVEGHESSEENNEALAKVQEAIANPSRFVLKPQKEGGGNNFFDEQLKAALTDPLRRDELRTYILMERIYPPQIQAHHFREGQHLSATSMSEIGFYSTIFAKNDRKKRDD
jgi:glutathione synthase